MLISKKNVALTFFCLVFAFLDWPLRGCNTQRQDKIQAYLLDSFFLSECIQRNAIFEIEGIFFRMEVPRGPEKSVTIKNERNSTIDLSNGGW